MPSAPPDVVVPLDTDPSATAAPNRGPVIHHDRSAARAARLNPRLHASTVRPPLALAPELSPAVSVAFRKLWSMSEESLTMQAQNLGMDHAEADHHGKLHHRLRGGREVASVLGVNDLDGEQLVALRDSYNFGWSAWA